MRETQRPFFALWAMRCDGVSIPLSLFPHFCTFAALHFFSISFFFRVLNSLLSTIPPPLFTHSLTPLLPPSPSTSIFHLGFYAYARSRGTTYMSTYPSPPIVQARHASPSLLPAFPPSICLVPFADGKKNAGSRHRKSLPLPHSVHSGRAAATAAQYLTSAPQSSSSSSPCRCCCCQLDTTERDACTHARTHHSLPSSLA
ncbi:hypothetical protein IWZ03DRAFT_33525 [Phyllosticta citriasiana]|uniref:Uncharacterized protein n=1 Tax=Phyllosticta citriasiana TaxID=595635 RepID=A0ABR1L1C3_9PEZI